MATNTGKGHVRREPVVQNKAQQPSTPSQPQQSQAQPNNNRRRPFIPPSTTELRSDSGFTRITMSDTPVSAPRNSEPARYIQLPQPPQPKQQQPPARRPASTRPNGPNTRSGSSSGSRPSTGNSNVRSNNSSRSSGPGSGAASRHGISGIVPNTPPDLSVHKGPGRGGHFAGKKKDDKRTRAEKVAEELELKLRQPRSRAQQVATEYVENEIGIVMLSEGVSVKELAEKCNRPAKDVVAKLLHRGILATINQPLDTELAKEIAREFGYLADIVTFEEDVQITAEESGEAIGEKLWRPPVVTIMGHVDHGKTSLLDAIRTSKIAEGEAGGITQAIGAYHVDIKYVGEPDRKIVFIDTPGHKAFTKMRARGAKVTDVVILVVAADDGVMPQTVEAINHAKAADVPMVIAINKIDKPGANPDKIEQELLQYGVQTEAYGGEVPCVRVSAKTKEGLETLLETVLLVTDLKELKAVYDCPAAGIIIEAKLDRGRGPVAAIIIQHGTVQVGDVFVSGATMGRVRAMFNDRLEKVTKATPSMAVQVLGFEEVPIAGDKFQVMESETKARSVVSFRQEKAGIAAQAKQRVTLENIFSNLKNDQSKELSLIIKCNTQGSVESLVNSLEQLSTDKAKVRIIHAAAGTVTENDILLAEASKASIIAFGVKVERKISELAHENNIDIRLHDTIYKVTEEISAAMIGLLDVIKKETVQGLAEVRQIFKVNKSVIAGSFVTEGKVRNDYMVHVKRGVDIIWNGKIRTLKRFKDDVTEVKNGLDCGIELDGFTGIKEGDYIEVYTLENITDTSL
jgi:translation initiation factor IF-2